MKNILLPLGLIFAGLGSVAQHHVPSPAIQIQTAVLSAPSDKRENSTVLGYNDKGELVELRKGTNQLISLADDPKVAGLVFLAAWALDANQAAGELGQNLPAAPGAKEFRPDAAGFVSMTRKGIDEVARWRP